jgi:ribosomal small subunit protein bTHX
VSTNLKDMGKGDKSSKKGKISAGTYGNTRRKKKKVTKVKVKAKPKKKVARKKEE